MSPIGDTPPGEERRRRGSSSLRGSRTRTPRGLLARGVCCHPLSATSRGGWGWRCPLPKEVETCGLLSSPFDSTPLSTRLPWETPPPFPEDFVDLEESVLRVVLLLSDHDREEEQAPARPGLVFSPSPGRWQRRVCTLSPRRTPLFTSSRTGRGGVCRVSPLGHFHIQIRRE